MASDDTVLGDIARMGVGELIHTMLVEFDRSKIGDSDCEGAFLQSEKYYWAAERLDDLFRAERA
jgi:hypothetical protein